MMHFERWSLLILGEALLREVTTPSDFERNLLIERKTLSSRLEGLVNSGLMDRVDAPDSTTEDSYTPTDKGRDLQSVMRELDDWSERWSLPVPTPADLSVSTDYDHHSTESRERPKIARIQVSVLGSFRLQVGNQVIGGLPLGSQRLLVFLALHDRPMSRGAVAGKMWPDSTHARAGVSLRSALSRLDPATKDAIIVASAGLALADTVLVDLHTAQDLAHRLVLGDQLITEADLSTAALETLSLELLPDWHDEWILEDAEDWRQLRTSALEEMAQVLTDRERPLEAASAARAAIRLEPLRESAHVALIRAHLAHGNRSEAIGAYERYRSLLKDVLDIDPSQQLTEMVIGIKRS
jgi:DNA-binding SARP family transcriptional activator/DNA-binding HxlR family transcriptional regulator